MSSMNFDINNDGVFDQVGVDVNEDGRLDFWSTDTGGDGVADEVAVDTDGSGAPDVWLVDRDQDNLLDVALRDNDLDGNFEVIPGTALDFQTVAGPLISVDSDGGTGGSNLARSDNGGAQFTPYSPSTPSYEDTADPDYDGKPNSLDSNDYDPYDSAFKDKDNDGEPDLYDKNPTRYEPYEDAD